MEIKLKNRKETYTLKDYEGGEPLPEGTTQFSLRYDSHDNLISVTGQVYEGKGIFKLLQQSDLEKVLDFVRCGRNFEV